MRANELYGIAKKAKDEGFDSTVKQIYRKVLDAAKVGEFEIEIAIVPWWNFQTKHVEFFVERGFKVDVGAKELNISWKMDI